MRLDIFKNVVAYVKKCVQKSLPVTCALSFVLALPISAQAEPVHVGASMPGGNVAWELPAASSEANVVVIDDAIFIATDTEIERHTQGRSDVIASAPLREENGPVVSLSIDDYTLYVVYESGAIDAYSVDLDLLWSTGILSDQISDGSYSLADNTALKVVDTQAALGYVSVLMLDEATGNLEVCVYQSVDGSVVCAKTIEAAAGGTVAPQIVHTDGAWVVLDSMGNVYVINHDADASDVEQLTVAPVALPEPFESAQSLIVADDKDLSSVYIVTTVGAVVRMDTARGSSGFEFEELASAPGMLMRDARVQLRAVAAVDGACLVMATSPSGDATLFACTSQDVAAADLPEANWTDTVFISTDLPSYNMLLASDAGVYMVDVKVENEVPALSEAVMISDLHVNYLAVGTSGEMICVDDEGAVSMVMAKGAATPSQNSDMISRLMGPGAFILVGMFVIYFIMISRAKRKETNDADEKDERTRR